MPKRRVHCYAASIGSDLAKQLISRPGLKGRVFLDPFAGSGTTLLAALDCGMQAIGVDVDPIACLICRTQTRRYSKSWLASFESTTLRALSEIELELLNNRHDLALLTAGTVFSVNGNAAQIPNRPEIDYWFSPTQRLVLAAVSSCMGSISSRRGRDLLSLAISSSIIRKWPNTLTLAMDIDHSRPHRVTPERDTIPENFRLFRRVFQQIAKTLSEDLRPRSESWLGSATIIERDCVRALNSLDPQSVDLIVSSPPYVNAIDYPRSHKFSEWWIRPTRNLCQRRRYIGLRGAGKRSDIAEQAVHVAPRNLVTLKWLSQSDRSTSGLVYRYVLDMRDVIVGCCRVLKSRGKLVFVLADNRIRGRQVPVVSIVVEMLQNSGFRHVKASPRKIKSNRRRYPFAFQGRMTSEAIITAIKR